MSVIPYTTEQLFRMQRRIDTLHAEALLKLDQAKWALSSFVGALEGPTNTAKEHGHQAEYRLREAQMWTDSAKREAIRVLRDLISLKEAETTLLDDLASTPPAHERGLQEGES